jgi:MFS family permease
LNSAVAEPAADPRTPEELAVAEAEYEQFVWDNLRRNYAGHYLHGMLGMTGFRLFNAPTFFPAYLHSLSGGSDVIVGLGLALQQLGSVISPFFGATLIEHRKRVLPVAAWIGTGMRLPILGIAAAGWFLSGLPGVRLWTIIACMFIFGIFQGAQGVAFQMLLAKVIPISRRGRLQAWRNVTGGLVAAGLSYVAGRYLIGNNVFGHGYSVTFILAFALTSAGLTALSLLMREPEPPTVRERSTVRQRLTEFPALFRGDRSFTFFTIAQVLASAGAFAQPFYILSVGHRIHITGALLGSLSLAFLGADTATNLGWGYMGDKFGFRSTFLLSLVLWSAATLLLIFAHSLPWVIVAFFCIGSAQSGQQMSSSTMVLEFGNRDEMAMRLAVSQTAQGSMRALGPLLGGLVASTLGYNFLFSVSLGFLILSLIVLTTLVQEPRNRRAALAGET